MNREEQILEMIRGGLDSFSNQLRGYRVVLFGSRATGSARERSDFDVGVLGESRLDLNTFNAIGDLLDQLPTLYEIEWVDLNGVSASFRENAMKEARVIHG